MNSPEEEAAVVIRDCLAEIVALTEWFHLWSLTWDLLASESHCDEAGGREWARVTAEARFFCIPADQFAMEEWIRQTANRGPANNVAKLLTATIVVMAGKFPGRN